MKNINYISSSSKNHTGSPKALLDLVANLDRDLYFPVLSVPEKDALSSDFEKRGGKVFFNQSLSLSKQNAFKFLKSVKTFRDFYLKNKIDLIHFNTVGWRDSAVVAAKICKIPIVLHLHNKYGERLVRGNFNFRLADKIIVVSEWMRTPFESHPRVLEKIECIHNGVDLKRFAPADSHLRGQLPVAGNGPVVGYVGQLCRHKGIDLLIKAAPAIVRQFPQALFVVAGADGVGEEGYGTQMQALASELGVVEHFIFLGKRDDVPDVMNACDCLVVPSRLEAFGKVIIEAMACGKCVIGAASGGIPEIIQDGQNGRLVEADNAEALQNAVLDVLGNEDLRDRLARNGHKTATDIFSIDALVDKTQVLYADLLK